MGNNIAISIVMPVYNSEKTIKKVVNKINIALLNRKDYEVIL